MPVRIRNGASSALSRATSSSWASRRSGDSPLATVSRGEWSVSAIHSWPSARAASAISPGGLPPSDQSECVWQSPRSAARMRWARPASGGFGQQPGQVVRLLAGRRLGDDLGGGLADPVQRAQRAVGEPAVQFACGQLADHLGGPAEGLHPVGRRARPLQHERDLAQRLYRVHAAI